MSNIQGWTKMAALLVVAILFSGCSFQTEVGISIHSHPSGTKALEECLNNLPTVEWLEASNPNLGGYVCQLGEDSHMDISMQPGLGKAPNDVYIWFKGTSHQQRLAFMNQMYTQVGYSGPWSENEIPGSYTADSLAPRSFLPTTSAHTVLTRSANTVTPDGHPFEVSLTETDESKMIEISAETPQSAQAGLDQVIDQCGLANYPNYSIWVDETQVRLYTLEGPCGYLEAEFVK